MKIYVACHDQKLAIDVAADLQVAGFEITAQWLTQPFGPSGSFDENTRRRFAMENYDDVRRSDALVLVAGPDRYSGGKFMEAGFAYALGKHVLVLGRRENLQCWGNHIVAYETRSELIEALQGVLREENFVRYAHP